MDHEAEGWVRMGDPAGVTTRARATHELLAPSWEVELSEDIVHAQWHKLLWNAGFNAICAVTGGRRARPSPPPRPLRWCARPCGRWWPSPRGTA